MFCQRRISQGWQQNRILKRGDLHLMNPTNFGDLHQMNPTNFGDYKIHIHIHKILNS